MDPKIKKQIRKVVNLLKNCNSILFVTGAGISADSGLPTYHGIGGLYNQKKTDEGIPIEIALAGQTLQTKPEITWKYLLQIEKRCRNTTFNRAHEVIAKLEKKFNRVWVLTQNIDGFHKKAGSNNVIQIHGDMHKLICPKCNWEKEVKDYSHIKKIPPICPNCKNFIRPDVVFFGEMLKEKNIQIFNREVSKGFDIYFSIGTTNTFPYIQEPIFKANQTNKPTIEINPSTTEVSDIIDIKIPAGAAETLDEIWNLYNQIT